MLKLLYHDTRTLQYLHDKIGPKALIPTHRPSFHSDGRVTCTCCRKECYASNSCGKHPLGPWKDGSDFSPERWQQFLARSARGELNCSIHLGLAGFAVIDSDVRHGGPDSVEEIEKLLGCKLPATAVVRTGGGGLHVYFTYAHGLDGKSAVKLRDKDGNEIAGVEMLAGVHLLQLPGNMHKSGRRYEWITPPWEQEIAELPDEIAALLRNDQAAKASKATSGSANPSQSSRPTTHNDIIDEIQRIRSRSFNRDDKYRRAEAYLRTIPGAIKGQHGYDHTKSTIYKIVVGFDLDFVQAFALLSGDWNAKCVPSWSNDELTQKINHFLTDPRYHSGRGSKLASLGFKSRSETERQIDGAVEAIQTAAINPNADINDLSTPRDEIETDLSPDKRRQRRRDMAKRLALIDAGFAKQQADDAIRRERVASIKLGLGALKCRAPRTPILGREGKVKGYEIGTPTVACENWDCEYCAAAIKTKYSKHFHWIFSDPERPVYFKDVTGKKQRLATRKAIERTCDGKCGGDCKDLRRNRRKNGACKNCQPKRRCDGCQARCENGEKCKSRCKACLPRRECKACETLSKCQGKYIWLDIQDGAKPYRIYSNVEFPGSTKTTAQIAADQLSGLIWAYGGVTKPAWGASADWRFPEKPKRDWLVLGCIDGPVDSRKALKDEKVAIRPFHIPEYELHILGGDIITVQDKEQLDRCLNLLHGVPKNGFVFRCGDRDSSSKKMCTTCPDKKQSSDDPGQVVHTPPRPPNRLFDPDGGMPRDGSAMASRQLFAEDRIHA